MTLTIGRCSSLRPRPGSPSVNGRLVTFAGTILAADANELQARRQQLLGIVNNFDEEVVPVVWASDSNYDGFYLPVSADVAMIGPSSGKKAAFTVTAERLPRFASPWFEVSVQTTERTNPFGITPAPVTATFVQTTLPYDVEGFTGTGAQVRQLSTPDDGAADLEVWFYAAPLAITSYRLHTDPTSFYWGSCRVELLYGATWYPMVGQEIPAARVWRISNGMVRLTSANGATSGKFEVWDRAAAAWESVNVCHWDTGVTAAGIGNGNGTSQPTVAVKKNSPEEVVVQVGGGTSSSKFRDYQMTYVIQRGRREVAWHYTTPDNFEQWGVGFTSVVASTNLTGGLRATSNDAGGNRLCFFLTSAKTTDTTNGRIWPTAAAITTSGCIGVEFGGSGATGNSTADAIGAQFMGATSWRQQVIVK